MTRRPLFSTYRQGENRVTGSMIAVFERIDVATLQAILATATEDPDLELVTFRLQPAASKGTVPDGEITSGFRYLFEVKTEFGAVREDQLRGHLVNLAGTAQDERLLVVTPDASEPAPVTAVKADDDRVIWIPFTALNSAIDLALTGEWIRDDERVLLRELQDLFNQDGLLGRQDTVIVAARIAYGFYLARSAYVCQVGRAFRDDLTHLGFYRSRKIEQELPRIMFVEDNVVFSTVEAARRKSLPAETDRRIGELVEAALAAGSHVPETPHKVFLLTPPGDPETMHLERPIVHAGDGAGSAFTMGQRYVYLDDLLKATTTADLR